jgi:hypothetical protein
LRTDLGRWLALLTHNSGTLVAWTGPGDPAAMAHYCQARADRDADLTHLLMRQCDWPPQARTVRVVSRSALLPVAEPAEIDRLVSASVGGGQPLYRLDTEAIRDLRPDLVLAQDLCAVCAVPSGQVTQALDVLGRQAEVSSLDPGRGPGRRAAGRQAAGVPERAEEVVGGLSERLADGCRVVDYHWLRELLPSTDEAEHVRVSSPTPYTLKP